MRYRKGMISVSDSRDIPLLLLIRNSRAISISQLITELMLDEIETNARSIHWRLNRLVESGLLERVGNERAIGEPAYAITHNGLALLEYRGHVLLSLGSFSKTIIAEAEVLHMLELNAIRLALKKAGILVEWKHTLQIVSENLVDYGKTTKDYDSVVIIAHEGRRIRFAIEYERTAKSTARYREIVKTIVDDTEIAFVLYLTPSQELLYLLAQDLRSLGEKAAIGVSGLMKAKLLGAPVVVVTDRPCVRKLGEILSELPEYKPFGVEYLAASLTARSPQ
jgi:Replication-relaxation